MTLKVFSKTLKVHRGKLYQPASKNPMVGRTIRYQSFPETDVVPFSFPNLLIQ